MMAPSSAGPPLRRLFRVTAAAALALLPGTAALAAETPFFPQEDLDFFERRIRPVLAEKCHSCHSVSAERLRAGLFLDTRDGLLKGGDNGPSIVPGEPGRSLLIELIHYRDPDMEMPPKTKLPDSVIADFETWIKNGAAWPAEPAPTAEGPNLAFDLEARRAEHWSWRPLSESATGPGFIDRLINAKLASADLQPALPADPLTLLRRLSFDLTGLPPTPGEIEQFQELTSQNPQSAIEKTVDRLLASPHFGERWARHWLDLMRYAESHGHEFDYPIHHATHYRNYVIRAFNADVPYHHLVAEHLAGDLLPAPRLNPDDQTNESIIATGFWYLGEAVHAPTDVRLDEADRIDNMVDTFSRSFLGLSVACARCHDHKFDAISTADYYALTGYLRSMRRHEHKQDPGNKIAAAVAEIRGIETAGNLTLAASAPPAPHAEPDDTLLLPSTSKWFPAGHAFGDAPVPTLGWLPLSNSVADFPRYDSGRYGEQLHGVLRTPNFKLTGKPIHVHVKGNGATARLIIDGYFMEPFNGLLFGGTRRDIETGDEWRWITFAGKNIFEKAGHTAYVEITDNGPGSVAVSALAQSEKPPDSNAIHPSNLQSAELQAKAADVLIDHSARAKTISESIPEPAATILAVADGTPENVRIHIRGSHKNLGEEIPRRFLTALGGEDIAPPATSSGRLELARQVVSNENPLTARVAANRIWHHLFGRGIVPTVDDFGPMGIAPSHSDLLDALATSLIANNWSQKHLIREIVLSRTYQQAAHPHPDLDPRFVADTDAENILLHKAPVRRLQAEAIRDAMLAISGRLEPQPYGDSVPVHLTQFMQGRGRPGSGPLDGDGRRSVYISIRRNFLPPMMLAFDMPSPFSTMGRRTVSNVPAQALTLMNDPFVIQESKRWAASTAAIQPAGNRIHRMFLQAFSRPPAPLELEAVLDFIQSHPDPGTAWNDLAHTLWNNKEFIFLN
jgi:hypothetical protein